MRNTNDPLWQGRAQLVLPFSGMTQRNCQLYSKVLAVTNRDVGSRSTLWQVGGYSQSYYSTNMVPPSTAGYDCRPLLPVVSS